MNANALLFLLSAKREGSWQQFRAAVEQLNLSAGGETTAHDDERSRGKFPLHRLLENNLRRLAHVEFFTAGCDAGWRVAPPVIAVSKSGDKWRGLLCGCRLPSLIEQLSDAANGCQFESIQLQANSPDTCWLQSPSLELISDVARRAKIYIQMDAPAAILAVLPQLNDSEAMAPTDLPFGLGWEVQRFSPRELSWQQSDREEASRVTLGLFRFTARYQPRQHIICRKGKAYRVPQQIGKFFLLKRNRVRKGIFSYDTATLKLHVKAICRPPLLVERALTLCSGMAPIFEPSNGCLIYTAINPNIAQAISSALSQEI